jgi:hypothetical protein
VKALVEELPLRNETARIRGPVLNGALPQAVQHFDGLPLTARSHFILHFYAATYQVISYVRYLNGLEGRELEPTFERFPFLAGYLAECARFMPVDVSWEDGPEWWERQIGTWETQVATHLPLLALGSGPQVSREGRLAFMIVGLVEEDSRFGTLFAELQAPLSYRRPTSELLGRMIVEETGEGDPSLICRELIDAGLVDVANPEGPRSEWIARVPDLLWETARTGTPSRTTPWFEFHEIASFPDVKDLLLPASVLSRITHVPGLIEQGHADALVIRGTQGSDRMPVAGAVASRLGHRVISLDGSAVEQHSRLLGPLCVLSGAVPVITYDLAPGETLTVPEMTGYMGPAFFLLGTEGGLRGPRVERSVSITLPFLRRSERLQHWQAGFAGLTVENLDQINERFHLPGSYIRKVAAAAAANSVLEGRKHVTIQDVRAARRMLNRQLLDTLAERLEVGETLADRLEHTDTWAHLVVSDIGRAKLRELEQRCSHRERVLDHLGPAFDAGTNRGVRVLFSGPSGTGKTLAAKLLSAKIGLDLYRVDLAAVINKYIGETEKNLHRILATAEELDVVLLLDEGDALLGRRTDVKSSNDRYANLETNYLLQRLEHYNGVVVVTTNLGENIDRAFQRRMDVSVDFLPPQADERLLIWNLHLHDGHVIDAAYLSEVASRCQLNGGQIRNAAHLATMLALEDGGPIGNRHLEEAVRSEYRKAGATCPLDGRADTPRPPGGLQAFLRTMG